MQYEPSNPAHRRALAAAIAAELQKLGFTRRSAPGEAIYAHEREPSVAVLVYTTIVGEAVRSVGEDAIRVALIYEGQPSSRGLAKDKAVHRVGTIPAIVGRLRERIIAAQRAELPRCRRCNGPAFLSRAGQPTCAAICWERHVEPVKPTPAPAPAPAPQVAQRPAAQPSAEQVQVMGKRDRNAPLPVAW
jgi:hypothetical protein